MTKKQRKIFWRDLKNNNWKKKRVIRQIAKFLKKNVLDIKKKLNNAF